MRDIKHFIIIDDDKYKATVVQGYVMGLATNADCKLFSTAYSGLAYLKGCVGIHTDSDDYCVITDMQMPLVAGDSIEKFAGEEVLEEMNREGYKCPVIIASSEKVDDVKMKSLYGNYLGSVRENSSVYTRPYYARLLGVERIDFKLPQ